MDFTFSKRTANEGCSEDAQFLQDQLAQSGRALLFEAAKDTPKTEQNTVAEHGWVSLSASEWPTRAVQKMLSSFKTSSFNQAERSFLKLLRIPQIQNRTQLQNTDGFHFQQENGQQGLFRRCSVSSRPARSIRQSLPFRSC